MDSDADLVTEKIKACDRADAALHTAQNALLLARAEIAALRESLAELRADTAARSTPDPDPPTEEEVGATQVPRLRSPVAQIIVDALDAAGDAGLSGAALNRIVAENGYKKDTSEKVKVFLKRSKLVRHDRIATHWYALGRGPKHIPGEG